MIPAHITRLMTFAQHGQPSGYAASDLMRADLEALIVASPLSDWKIEPTQLDDELSIVPPFDAKRRVQPRGICVAAWSTCEDSRTLYALARSILSAGAGIGELHGL